MGPSVEGEEMMFETLETRTMMSAAPLHAAHPAAKPVKPAANINAPLIHKLTTINPSTTSKSITYKSFASDPLFASNGPTISDINQGYLGDCYLLATLSSVVKTDPTLIKNDIAVDGNGVYTITLGTGKTAQHINVNSDLPVLRDGSVAYAQLGNQNCLWVALMEKAYVEYAAPKAMSYAAIEGGWMTSAFSALGLKSQSIFSSTNGTTLLATLKADLGKNDFVTLGTNATLPTGSPLIAGHAYEIDSVNSTGTELTLRNPWGNGSANDGYVTITADQAFTAFAGVVISHV
jgi:hypothetical protein